MDLDQALDHNCMRIREKLNQDCIKLWLPPYLTDDQSKNVTELKNLALILSGQLSLAPDICLQHLENLQTKAVNNLNERNNFRITGQASLKVRVPSNHGGYILTTSTELSKTGLELRTNISKLVSVPVHRLKLIFKGKFLKDDEILDVQGIKHGLQIMAIILNEHSDSIIPKQESHIQELDSTKADVELLSKTKYFQIADQSGKLLKLPPDEKKSLILAMTLHEKGRAAMKNEDYNFALVMLLEAEREFCHCNSSLLKTVDNYGVLGLDIVWCYLNLQSVTQLPDAEERLRQCEQSFEHSYGLNLERLAALKGFTENESALFVRLHLLQAIVFYHQNKIDEAGKLLSKVEEELQILKVDDGQICQLIELGYEAAEARLALRASKGDISRAVSIIEDKRSEKKKNEDLEARERKLRKKNKKLGKCINGEWIEPQLYGALLSMGFCKELSKWALALTNNDINLSINLINDKQQSALNHQEVASTACEPETANSLKVRHDNSDQAMAELSSGGYTSGLSTDSESDSDSYDEEDDHSAEGSIAGSSSKLRKERNEAYSRLKEGLSNTEDDHLDLNLMLETTFLHKYKELLSKR